MKYGTYGAFRVLHDKEAVQWRNAESGGGQRCACSPLRAVLASIPQTTSPRSLYGACVGTRKARALEVPPTRGSAFLFAYYMLLPSLPRKPASSAQRGATIAANPAQPRDKPDLLSRISIVYKTKLIATCQAMGAHSTTISGPAVGTLQPTLVLGTSPVEAQPTPRPVPAPPSASHVIRPFDLERDLDDLNAICANVCKLFRAPNSTLHVRSGRPLLQWGPCHGA